MGKLNPTRLMQTVYPASAGRKFGLTLGVAFAVIAVFAFWREQETASRILGGMAIVLVLAAGVTPKRLEPVERIWMSFAGLISRVTTPIFMGIIYFAVLTPTGIIRRTVGRNPLVHALVEGSYWIARPPMKEEDRRKRMERQF